MSTDYGLTELKEVEIACGACGYHTYIYIECGVDIDWHETIYCPNCQERDLIQYRFIGDESDDADSLFNPNEGGS